MDDLIAAVVSRDQRFAALHQAIAVEADLQSNATIRAFTAAIRANADVAMLELADMSPLDTAAVSAAMVKIKAYVELKRMIEFILNRGRNAEAEIKMEDQHFGPENDS